jgi:hypothetical protein
MAELKRIEEEVPTAELASAARVASPCELRTFCSTSLRR